MTDDELIQSEVRRARRALWQIRLDPEDVVQEVWVQLLQCPERNTWTEAYKRGVIRNQVRNALRAYGGRADRLRRRQPARAKCVTAEITVARQLQAPPHSPWLHLALERLPALYREAIQALCIEERGHTVWGKAHGRSQFWAYQTRRRALAALRKEMGL